LVKKKKIKQKGSSHECYINQFQPIGPLGVKILTSLGSAKHPTMAASIASWFSILDARAAIKHTISLSTPFVKACTFHQNQLSDVQKRKNK